METDGDSPTSPLWSDTASNTTRRRVNSVFLILSIPILLLIILFFLLPNKLPSQTNNIPTKPNPVKKGWDSINVFLVLFAVLCGIFARRNDENTDAPADSETVISNVSDQISGGGGSWLDFPDRKEYNKLIERVNYSGGKKLSRSSSSYPDLREESLWGSEGNRFKFFDDLEVDMHRPPSPENLRRRERRSGVEAVTETLVKEIAVDEFQVNSGELLPPASMTESPAPPATPKPPEVRRRRSVQSVPVKEKTGRSRSKAEFSVDRSPPPLPEITESPAPAPPLLPVRRRRSDHRVPLKEKTERSKTEAEFNVKRSPPPPAPPPPPPPPPEIANSLSPPLSPPTVRRRRSVPIVPQKEKIEISRSEAEFNVKRWPPPPPAPPPPPEPLFHPLAERLVHRKKSGTTKEIASALASLYTQKKVKTRDIYETATQNSSFSAPPSTPPPPPPPPPPPSKMFKNLFKKSSKNKRVHSVPTTTVPPPPPPPPPNSIFNNLFKTGSKSKRFLVQSESSQPPPPPPPPPAETRRRNRPSNSGKPPKPTRSITSENSIFAPMSPLIPMPPPPPPPPFRLPEMKFVANGDFVRIRSGNSSPDRELEDYDVMSVKSDGGDSIGPSISCPSPDVNSKADTFISRLHDEWRMEKVNSMKGKKNLGYASTRPNSYAF